MIDTAVALGFMTHLGQLYRWAPHGLDLAYLTSTHPGYRALLTAVCGR
jgi:hypothetical protein